MPKPPWYTWYAELKAEIANLKQEFEDKCTSFGVSPAAVHEEFWKDQIARIVHESNWQEGIYLEPGRTKELSDALFDDLKDLKGPHLDMEEILKYHRKNVLRMKRERAAVEEVAAYNLSRAHMGLSWVGSELASRQAATLMQALRGFEKDYESRKGDFPPEARQKISRGLAIVREVTENTAPAYGPLTGNVGTEGELAQQLLDLDFEELLHPMRVSYIHFLHRITMMGIQPANKCGVFRSRPVHVDNPDLLFSPPSLIQGMMEQFCRKFPPILPGTVEYDPIRMAGRTSYMFVRIHPYADGNGRVSRLLMNLVLWGHFPPVSLKADKKGRHRYGQALRRGDRGNTEPLACLIAISIRDTYKKMIDAVRVV